MSAKKNNLLFAALKTELLVHSTQLEKDFLDGILSLNCHGPQHAQTGFIQTFQNDILRLFFVTYPLSMTKPF